MSDIQEQMNAILGNPEMMQKIMSMAQNLNAQPKENTQPPSPAIAEFPNIDISMMQKLSGLASKSNIDNNQRSLLKALTPYLSKGRIQKLEKAMRAAKMAGMASVFLNQNGFRISGR